MTNKEGYGLKDGSQRGKKSNGRRKNQTTKCRHPKIKNK